MNPRMALKNCLAKNNAASNAMFGVADTCADTNKKTEILSADNTSASNDSDPKNDDNNKKD